MMLPRSHSRQFTVGQDDGPARPRIRMIPVRPDETMGLWVPEEILVIVDSTSVANVQAILQMLSDLTALGRYGIENIVEMPDGTVRGAQVYIAFLPILGATIAEDILAMGIPGQFAILRSDYAQALKYFVDHAPEIFGAALADAAVPFGGLPDEFQRKLNDFMKDFLGSLGKGIWKGFWPVLLIGGGALFVFAYTKGRR